MEATKNLCCVKGEGEVDLSTVISCWIVPYITKMLQNFWLILILRQSSYKT